MFPTLNALCVGDEAGAGAAARTADLAYFDRE